jgi:hypothetical protein
MEREHDANHGGSFIDSALRGGSDEGADPMERFPFGTRLPSRPVLSTIGQKKHGIEMWYRRPSERGEEHLVQLR